MELNKIYQGLNIPILKTFPDNSIDSCVTDPPYGLKFMGKKWDYDIPTVDLWHEVYRVLKPGAHILVACGTRTQHRMAVNIEDAGFEIRDVITWHYGSGFPKSLDVSKAIDKQAGAEREKIKIPITPKSTAGKGTSNELDERPWLTKARAIGYNETDSNEAVTEAAKQYEGYGTALKPATEFWTLGRKPISENTVAENVLKYGTGGINLDGCRIEYKGDVACAKVERSAKTKGILGKFADRTGETTWQPDSSLGRFPANVIFDEFMGAELDKQTGILTSGNGKEVYAEGDSGGASRFFYCPKPDNFERSKGLKNFELKNPEHDFGTKLGTPRDERVHTQKRNIHPTVKPIDLMRYLVRLITPKNGIVLDPFNGSGTTGIAAKMELMNYIGIEQDEDYCKISEARIAAWNPDKYKEQTLF